MPSRIKKVFTNKTVRIASLSIIAAGALGVHFSSTEKSGLITFLQKHELIPSAHAQSTNPTADQITTSQKQSDQQDHSSAAKTSTQERKYIVRDELPANWPEEIKEHATQFKHPDSPYWRKQIAAHKAQERTPGWIKFETYAITKNRDVLALPTFKQMIEADRSEEFVIVQLQGGTDTSAMNELGLEHDTKLGGKLISGLHRFRFDSSDNYEIVLEAVNAHPSVLYAEPDYTIQEALVPNDPNIGPDAWWLDQINAYAAWDISTDATAIGPIAVFDNGILVTHEDLADNLWVNANEIAGNGIDDDGNGYVDDVHGITVSSGSMGHGTPVAGTICGQGDNNIGYAGSAWDCELMELRSGLTWTGTISDFAIAMPYAVSEGSRISNHSWRIFDYSQMLADTVTAIEGQGHLMVAAAGNENNDIDFEAVNYPARLPNDNVLTIAASTTDESKISYSSWGATSVDIAAPTEFFTANSSGSYSRFSGTSQASPVVTGAVALAWAQAPTLTYSEIKQIVLDTARPVASWSGLTVTGGILDMEALMLNIDPDTDGDGMLDSVDPDDDNDGVLDENDAFPRDPNETTDSDGDGVGDNGDLFPSDPTEWEDSDGDGVGNNGDAFPNDPTETLDSDGDGYGDNSDLFPTDPTEWLDSDTDGVGDNSDPDRDNDGLANSAEGELSTTAPARQILTTGGTDSYALDLSAFAVSPGSLLDINLVTARGDLGFHTEYFNLTLNSGEYVSPNLTTSVECGTTLVEALPTVNETVRAIDIGGGLAGLQVDVTASSNVNNICAGSPRLALEYQFSVTAYDHDGDGLSNTIDLDSDGDGLTDIIEIGLSDSDSDGRIDGASDEASITVAPDDDADGIPNHLDLESTNPLNDGTAYDIFVAGYAALDTNGDGRITDADDGTGTDANNNGIDDLVESTTPQPDSDRDTYPDSIDVFPADPTEWLDSDGDGVGDNSDAMPLDPTETSDSDNDGVGDNSDPDIDNDGIANDSESPGSANVASWPILGNGITADENTLLFNDGGSPYPRQANSVTFSTLGYSDQYQLSWSIDTASEEYAFAVGVGATDSDASLADIDYGFWFDGGWYGIFESGSSQDIWGNFIAGSSEFAIVVNGSELSYIVDGTTIRTVTLSGSPDFYIDTSLVLGDISAANFILSPIGGFTGDVDADDDGIDDRFDLDSDNDTIPDIIEAGLSDADSNRMIDTLADEASVTTPPDSDGDGIPNHLDPESLNPANDGTAFDISTGTYALFDTNGNGVLDSGDIAGGTDANGNGVDDLLEGVDSDGDRYPDSLDAYPGDPNEWVDSDGDGYGDNSDPFPSDSTEWLDSDGDGYGDNSDPFPTDPTEWLDSDGDGVGDNSDVYPNDPTESADSDGDGVGDNGDAFPNDPTETVDSDGDGVGDNSDVFPADPSEWLDSDGDGTGDNSDPDIDNDGLANSAEGELSTTSPVRQIVESGGTDSYALDLSASGVVPGTVLEVSQVLARGDLGFSLEDFTLTLNSGEYVSPDLTTSVECGSVLEEVSPAVNETVTAIDIGGGLGGLQVDIATNTGVHNICSGSLRLALEYQFSITAFDHDSDGIGNGLDLDSDGDGLTDIVEIGLLDIDNDGRIDTPSDEASITVAPDDDADGIPNHLDLESTNPLNDGTAYDIHYAGYGMLDTNGDGRINGLDDGAGIDANNNGIDDLIESTTPQPDSDRDGFIDSIDMFPADPTEWTDSDGDGVGDNGDAFPLDPTETMDGDGDGIGDNSDIDRDNDGLADSAEASSASAIADWTTLGDGILGTESGLSFDDGGNVFPRQANSVVFDEYGYSAADDYRVSWSLDIAVSEYAFALGFGSSESGPSHTDIEYGFWTDGGWWGLIENGTILDVWGVIESGVTEFSIEHISTGSINYLIDGAVVYTTSLPGPTAFYFDSSFYSGVLTANELTIEPLSGGNDGEPDADGDGIDNVFDLDSDNDTIPDIIEIGLVDADGNFMVDLLSDQGSISIAPDSDGDSLPDHLDLESLNPANDGTAFDIANGAYGALDTNGDGQLNSDDIGGGIDANNNGVDDLIEP